jgi:hypothetical protein
MKTSTNTRQIARDADVGITANPGSRRGQWLVNGSADGLVEITIESPCYIERSLQHFLSSSRHE